MRNSGSFLQTPWALIALFTLNNCGPKPAASIPQNNLPNGRTLAAVSGDNVLTFTVNGSTCSNTYINKPCVNIEICAPGNSANCQTVNDILLDSGSFGLRVFQSVLTPALSSALTAITTGGQPIFECTEFGDGSADWGPVKLADVVLGSEPPVKVPIQVINATAATAPYSCGDGFPEESPASAGFNGILGIGLFKEDCGTGCATQPNNGNYFSCTAETSGAPCTKAAASLQNQVQNPIPLLPVDNNGVILEFPSIPFGGVSSVTGYLILGIGTQTNNIPSGVTLFGADSLYGEFTTSFDGKTVSSFLDSGSNGLFFAPPTNGTLPGCSSSSSWFCPSALQSLSAVTIGNGGSPSNVVSFNIGNFHSLFTTSNNNVFVEIGASGTVGGSFDWGLPFFLGRNVYIGINKTTSTLGTGPYWAF